MAAFFKVPTSAGIVVRAAHVFASRPALVRSGLTCGWTRDAEGRLVRSWGAESDLVCGATEPATGA